MARPNRTPTSRIGRKLSTGPGRLDAEQVREPAPLEHGHHRAEGGEQAEQEAGGGLERHQDAAEHEQQQYQREADHHDQIGEQRGGQLVGHVDVHRSRAGDVDAGSGGLVPSVGQVSKVVHEVDGRRVVRTRRWERAGRRRCHRRRSAALASRMPRQRSPPGRPGSARRRAAGSPAPVRSATITKGPLVPGPNESLIASYAARCVVPGSAVASEGMPRRRSVAGMARMPRPATAAISSGTRRRTTNRPQRSPPFGRALATSSRHRGRGSARRARPAARAAG